MQRLWIALFGAMLMASLSQAAPLFTAAYDGNTANSGKDADVAAGSPAPTVAGTATIDTAVKKYGAASLNPSAVTSGNNGLRYSTASNFNPLAGTVELWFRAPGYDGTTRQELFSIFAGGYTGDFSLYLDNTQGGRLKVDVDVAGANQWAMRGYQPASYTGDGNWHHVAFEWDTAAGYSTLYLDGAAETYTPLFGTVSFTGGTLGTEFEIGSRQRGYDALQGNIDDVRISDVAVYQQTPFTPPGPFIPEPASAALAAALLALLSARRRGC